MAAEILEEVMQKLTGPTQVVDLNVAIRGISLSLDSVRLVIPLP
jgi:hypothetical protein